VIILLFIYGYVVGLTLFVGLGTYRLCKQYRSTVTQTITKTRYVTKGVTRKEIQKLNKEKKMLRDRSYDAVYSKCLEAADSGEVVYFSLEDINRVVNELKKEQMN